MPLVVCDIELNETATTESRAALERGASDYQTLAAAAQTATLCGQPADLSRALAQLPPGRSLALEYLRLRSAVASLQKQVQRSIELRIAADQRASKKRIPELKDRIEQLERLVKQLFGRPMALRVRELEAQVAWLSTVEGARTVLSLEEQREYERSL